MLGGLYGSLPKTKNAAEQEAEEKKGRQAGWAAGSMAPPRAKSSLFAPSSLKGTAPRSKPTSATQRQQAMRTEAAAEPSMAGRVVSVHQQGGTGSFDLNLRDEYDPAKPNDYEEIRRQREQQRISAEQVAQQQEALRAQLVAQEAAARAVLAAAVKPEEREVALNVTGEEAFARRARLTRGGGAVPDNLTGSAAEQLEQAAQAMGGGARGMDLAAKMMQRMGWKEGSGLGRNKQGIVTPLMHQKTDKRGGVIVSGPDTWNADAKPEDGNPEQKPKGASVRGTPTRVILLRNMVGPGQVDPELEEEVAQECTTKYGAVQSVMIFEVTTPGFPPEQAVRIFVEFERVEEATKALVDLDNRFFGGRQVSAVFFPEERLEKNDLGPKPGD